MPAPDASKRGRPEPRVSRDPTAIPSFLRERDRGPASPPPSRPTDRPLVLPKPANPQPPEASGPPAFDPAALPMPSLSRRRVITAAGVLLAGWLALSFARQVGEATAATSRAEDLRLGNAALRDEIARLEEDLLRVQDRRYILQQGRSAGLGVRGEVAFALAGEPPPLAPDAPGAAAARLGSAAEPETPLEAWLGLLFGPD